MSDDQPQGEDDVGYDVGYRRPPKDHQFQRGKSGNPKGRPKGAKGFKTLVQENLAKPVQVKMDGKMRTVTIGEAILMRTLRDAVSGGKSAAEQGLKLMERYGPAEPEEPKLELSLAEFSIEELTEFERLIAKATGQTEQFEELERKRQGAQATYLPAPAEDARSLPSSNRHRP
jgi:hypothetical protein